MTARTTTTFTGMNAAVDTQNITISYNAATNQLSETGTGTSNNGRCQRSVSWSTNYGSLADFVDEVGVIPPKTRWASQSGMATYSGPTGPCENGTYAVSQANSYDGQGRLVRSDSTGRGISFFSVVADLPGTHVYTAWDVLGRPTVSPVEYGASARISYDDLARTRSYGGTVDTFDSNGNLVRHRTVSISPPGVLSGAMPFESTYDTIFVIDATARVCR